MSTPSRLRRQPPAAGPLRVMIVGPTGLPGVDREVERLRTLLAHHGHSVSSHLATREAWERYREWEFGDEGGTTDLVLVLGGDGSILRTARWMGRRQAPVLGVNLGRLGFLADCARDEVDAALAEITAGRFTLVDHLMLDCEVLRSGATLCREHGLNEVSIVAGPPFSMIDIHLHVDGDLATTYRSDGLIVSTPVGSTAYNLSAGGPILRKDLEAFVFTPLNPHTLTNRTVVDSAARDYELLVPNPNPGSACVVDGRVITGLAAGDRVRVRRADTLFTLVETRRHGYYRTLREKLAWGGGLQMGGPRPGGSGP